MHSQSNVNMSLNLQTYLNEAIKQGQLDTVTNLLTTEAYEKYIDSALNMPQTQSYGHQLPIFICIRTEKINTDLQEKILKALITAGANTNISELGSTPLHEAVRKKNLPVIKILVDLVDNDDTKDAKIETKNNAGITPLELAQQQTQSAYLDDTARKEAQVILDYLQAKNKIGPLAKGNALLQAHILSLIQAINNSPTLKDEAKKKRLAEVTTEVERIKKNVLLATETKRQKLEEAFYKMLVIAFDPEASKWSIFSPPPGGYMGQFILAQLNLDTDDQKALRQFVNCALLNKEEEQKDSEITLANLRQYVQRFQPAKEVMSTSQLHTKTLHPTTV